jgi:hypothetical protein
MGCKSCKQGKESSPLSKEEIQNVASKVQKWVLTFFIIWSLFAIYGIYSFITNII